MIKFFRKIRYELLEKNKTGKYFKYAIGEIILVVIGILIALSISNWNSKNTIDKTINEYYISIQDEIDLTLDKNENLIIIRQNAVRKIKKCKSIIESKNKDSIEVIKENIGSIVGNYTLMSSLPTVESFSKSELFVSVHNKEIKSVVLEIEKYLVWERRCDVVASIQYENNIEPYFIEYLNLSTTSQPDNWKDPELYSRSNGGPVTNFEFFYDNMKFWNIMNIRIERLEHQKNGIDRFNLLLEEFEQLLKKELQN